MGNKLPAIIIVLAVVVFAVFSSIFVVNEREQAIVARFGEIRAVHSEPGLYFKLPFTFAGADTVQFVEDRAMRFDLDDIRVQVSGGAFYDVDAFVVYRIQDAERFRQAVSADIVSAEARLRTRLDSALRRAYGLRGFEAALSEERQAMMDEVASQLRTDAENLGLLIEDVRIRRTDLTQQVSQQTYERMIAERLAEAELIRARGREGAQRLRAVADRQVVEIVSEATRDAEIVRGEGDAERNRIYAEAYSRDEDFFDFYRSMSAYAVSLSQDSDTTMVLSPDSEFFRYFRDASGGTVPVASGAEQPVTQPADEGADAAGDAAAAPQPLTPPVATEPSTGATE
jgi:modulator of FtsH protease HflC